MCGRFLLIPKDVVDDIIREVEIGNAINLMPDWPATRQSAYPRSEVAVILSCGDHLVSEVMQWGYEASWSKEVLFNTRADTALKAEGRNMWRESLCERRCIVPTFGFFEPHKTETFINRNSGKKNKQQYLFTSSDSPILFLAGVFESGHFSIMTTSPNQAVAPIHARMPVVLRQNKVRTWLCGAYESLFDQNTIKLNSERVF